FGCHIPFLLVLGADIKAHELPFADLAISVHELPSLVKLKLQLKLNPEVQRILIDGDPGEVGFSSENQVIMNWSEAVTLHELADKRLTYPASSLAASLQKVLLPIKRAAQ